MLNKFEIIAEKIRQDIQSGKYSEKLPSEKMFSKIYKTTNVTAAKALNLLRDGNIVVREKGKGSFVNPDYFKKHEITFSILRGKTREKLFSEFKSHFPSLNYRNADGTTKAERIQNSDLSIQVSAFPASYEKFFSPLPRNYVEECNRKEIYYFQAFNIHRKGSLYYGIPVLFSPFVLIYNKQLLRELNVDINLFKLTYADLKKLESKLEKLDNKYLFSSKSFRHSTVMSYIFPQTNGSDSNNRPVETNTARISSGLEKMESLFRRGISSQADFNNGNVLFSYTCRQNLRQFSETSIDFDWDLCPLPTGTGGFRPVASESIFISANSSRQDFLFTLGEFFLSPKIQNIVAVNKFGVPVLKTAAIDSIESTNYRDDLFFSEIKKAVFHYDFLENNLLGTFRILSNRYFDNKISFNKFRNEILQLHKLNELHKRNEIAAVDLTNDESTQQKWCA